MERSRPALPSGTKGGFMTLVPQPNSPDDTIVAPRRLAVRGAQPQPDPYDDLDRNRARLARRGVPADAPAPRDPQQRAGGPGPRRAGVRIGASPRPQPQIAEHGAAEGAPVGGRATPRA